MGSQTVLNSFVATRGHFEFAGTRHLDHSNDGLSQVARLQYHKPRLPLPVPDRPVISWTAPSPQLKKSQPSTYPVSYLHIGLRLWSASSRRALCFTFWSSMLRRIHLLQPSASSIARPVSIYTIFNTIGGIVQSRSWQNPGRSPAQLITKGQRKRRLGISLTPLC